MIGIIHSNWESDIVLEKGNLEDLISGETLVGDIADYPNLGKVFLSVNKDILALGFYFNLNWNKKEPLKYHFEIYPEGLEKLKINNYVHGRYDNGSNGSKLDIYCEGKDELLEDNIRFAIQMRKLEMENKS
jgi:hypothetical protein